MINHDKGFTLIEVLAASAILGMVVLSFAFLTSYTANSKMGQDYSSKALAIAKKEMTDFRSLYTNPINRISASHPSNIIDIDFEDDPAYHISVHHFPLDTNISFNPSEHYNMESIQENSVSLQSILLVTEDDCPIPHLFTVTVSWNGDSQ